MTWLIYLILKWIASLLPSTDQPARSEGDEAEAHGMRPKEKPRL
jgi:hypothetical protein